nr:hypothetical protein [Coxiella-like endosymbiont]
MVKHLIRVDSSLDSMIVWKEVPQIFGQMKQAFR